MTKKELQWVDENVDGSGRPPLHYLAMKDPYGLDNIARAVDSNRLRYIKESFDMARHVLECESTNFDFAFEHLTEDPPKPDPKETNTGGFEAEDARRMLLKKHFKGVAKRRQNYGAAASEEVRQTTIASDITQSVVGWLGNSKNKKTPQ